jgi:ribonuclease-3
MLKKEALATIEQTIGYQFKDKQLISQAFTRSSYHYEHLEEQSNEVMEFVGDSVLSLLVVDNLLDRYTGKDGSGLYSCLNEGDFSSIRSFMVNKSFLAKKMRKLDLHQFLRMSIGDEKQGIENSISVLEDLFESIVGAIYLDVGRNLNKTKKIVLPLLEIESELDEYDGKIKISYKNLVQEWCDKYGYSKPVYNTYQTQDGFVSICCIRECDNIEVKGCGLNRREAEKAAAEIVYLKLEDIESSFASVDISFENAINMLQEYCQNKDIPKPEYKTIKDVVFDDNSHEFTVCCTLNGRYTEGKGERVKEAKKDAAYKMLDYLGVIK